jgi:hypothetical protein
MSAEFEPGHRRPEGSDLPEPDPEPDGRRGRGRGGSGGRDGRAGDGVDSSRILWLLAGAGAIAAGTALGWDSTALASVVSPPPLIRAALVGGSVALGVVLLLTAVTKLAGESPEDRLPPGVSASGLDPQRDISEMIRGVRLVFLAVAAFAAASGWLLGHPLPLVVALVIAGVDVLETSFLLIVVALHRRD